MEPGPEQDQKSEAISALERILNSAQALLDGIQHDDNGGGLLTRKTCALADQLRRDMRYFVEDI